MALSRKALAAMGIEADKIDQIVEMNSESVSGLKDRISELEEDLKKADNYKEEAEKLKAVQKELDDLKKKNEVDAKERAGKNYDKLKREFDAYKEEVTKKEVRKAKEDAYKEILKDAGIPERHFAKILKYSDVDSVELDEKGKIKTSKEILKEVKEEWGDHIETTITQGATTPKPPSSGGKTKMSREDIYKRDKHGRFVLNAEQRQKAIEENMSEFS